MDPLTIVAITGAAISVGSIALKALRASIHGKSTKNRSTKITIRSKSGGKIEVNTDENNPKELMRSVDKFLHMQ